MRWHTVLIERTKHYHRAPRERIDIDRWPACTYTAAPSRPHPSVVPAYDDAVMRLADPMERRWHWTAVEAELRG